MGKSFRTLHTLPKPPPSVDSGKEKGAGGDVKSLPPEYNGMSNIKSSFSATTRIHDFNQYLFADI